jgi:uncharacterized repeat protein (TIGR02543 family)
MKSTNPNNLRTTGDKPVAIKSASPPRRLLRGLAIAALAGFASSAWADELIPTITTRGDGKTVATFSAVGTGIWTVPTGVSSVEVLVLGGGGAGAKGGAFGAPGGSPGGGAGGFYSSVSYPVTGGGTVNLAVGAGAATTTSNGSGGSGTNSVFDQLIAYGGQGGDYTTNQGGNQGGYSINNGVDVTAGFLGGTGNGATGGGGAGENGRNGGYSPAYGGAGVTVGITGSAVGYGGGGSAGYDGAGLGHGALFGGGEGSEPEGTAGTSGVNGLGGGGGGGRSANGGGGGSGIVIVAYDSGVTMRTVTFDSNGGSPVSSQIVPDGSTATQPTPAPTRTGYTFVEWSSDIGLTSAFNFSSPITADTTLYAKWLANWTVTFDSNGGSSVPAQSITPGGTATQPTPAPTRTGYTFVEWSSDIGLTTAFSFSNPITADLTLYAKWTINSYTLTYSADSNGSIDGVTPQTVEYDGSGTAVTAVPNSGYQFLKWSDNKTANPRTDINIDANINVMATFELIPPPITPTTVTTRGDGYTVAIFTAGNGPWTVPAGVTVVEVLVVGGGGAGAKGGAFGAPGGSPGGGAGGFYSSVSYPVTGGGTVNLAVGTGAATTTSNGSGGSGTNSVFDQIIAYGGQGGDYTTNQGGNQGGYSINNGVDVTAGFLGGTGNGATGGGGAGENGKNGGFEPAYGGAGVTVGITGSPVGYGGGGSAGYDGAGLGHGALFGGGEGSEPEGTAGTSGVNGLGGGGGGGRSANGGGGGSGTVIIAYLTGGSSAYTTWAAGPFANAFTDTNSAHDPDGDGLTNQQEFAFGLDPTTGASVNPITAPLDKSNHKFSYTRYAASGLTYTVWTSADLEAWDLVLPGDMTENAGTPNGAGVATVEVTLTNPPVGDKLFVRVQAE